MLVQDFLHISAGRLPEKTALICDDRRLTYADLDEIANRLANALIARGIERGDRIVIFLNNSLEAVAGIFAALKAGGVFVIVHHTTKRNRLAYILNNCQAKALLFGSQNAALVEDVLAEVPSLRVCVSCGKHAGEVAATHERTLSFDSILATYPAGRPPQVNIDLDLACLIYTSGSTGVPKGVMSDHGNIVFATGSIIEYLENVEDDIVICALPLSFDYGLYQLLMVFRFGGTLVLEKGFAFPAALMQRMQDERVTGLPIVPTMMAILLKMDLSVYDLSSLRYVTNTAAALPPNHIQGFRRRFPNVTIYSMYGLTETKRTLYLPPDQLEMRPGSVGIAIPGTEVWLEDDYGNRLDPGAVGELVIRGRHVMRGYWGDPEATALRFRPGPLPGERVCYSGDLFRMDEKGYLYFLGRKDDIIKSRGEKVAPKEIENVLYQLPGIVEAAVIGVPDPVLGQAIKALVVCREDNLTEAEILAHCRANLEDLMIPRYVEFRDELPKTTSGKINKQELT
ncbi:MAG: AMP-binding protein [Anaerolineae bacterium]|nr:AMP-binding protein [Anaerolineae bacterium]